MATPRGTSRGDTVDEAARERRFERGRGRGRDRLGTETKHSSKTSELYIYLAAVAGVLIAGLITDADDGTDRLVAQDVWTIVAILTAAYLVSRGLAKAGSRDPYWSDRDDR